MAIKKRGRSVKRKWTSERVKALRERYGESQAKFAERLRVSIDTIQYWEQGRGPVSGLGEFALDRLEEDIDKQVSLASA